jgi:hypothetical protein
MENLLFIDSRTTDLQLTLLQMTIDKSQSHVTTNGPSVSLSWCEAPICGLRLDFYYWQLPVCRWGALSLTRELVCSLQLLLVSPAQSFLGPSAAGLVTIFYCLRFETPPNLEGQVPVFISPRNRVLQLYPQTLGLFFVASYVSRATLELFEPASTRSTDSCPTADNWPVSIITSRYGLHWEHYLLLYFSDSLGTSIRRRYPVTIAYTCLLRFCYLAADVVLLFVSRPLPSNGTTRYNIVIHGTNTGAGIA